jgi:site-specific DNA recombinase
MKPSERKVFRCAIYTRKSTEHNLDLEFNSLDAQREACEAYIKSQAHEGWRLVADHYDDGGISGASLERPALQALLADVRAGKINTVVVYKVDRLTRSLADFAKLVELFDQYEVSFVSITQSFNTTSSMGRLTLNVLLSFAQFEREVIGERVRDKIAASKRKGIWVGGPVPLGYRVIDKKLVVVPEEAEAVRIIFTSYLQLGSIGALIEDLDRRGIRTKANGRPDVRQRGGIRFGVGSLAHLLKNRFYIGEVSLSPIEPVSGKPKRKLENNEQRLRLEKRGVDRLRPLSLRLRIANRERGDRRHVSISSVVRFRQEAGEIQPVNVRPR